MELAPTARWRCPCRCTILKMYISKCSEILTLIWVISWKKLATDLNGVAPKVSGLNTELGLRSESNGLRRLESFLVLPDEGLTSQRRQNVSFLHR